MFAIFVAIVVVVAVAVIGGAVASQNAPSGAAAAEGRQDDCEWCSQAIGWYSDLSFWRKCFYVLWRMTTAAWCLLKGCG